MIVNDELGEMWHEAGTTYFTILVFAKVSKVVFSLEVSPVTTLY
jgi:hypothetical protein